MHCVKDFESRGRFIQGQGGDGFVIDLDDWEEIECSDQIVNLCHIGLGRYEIEDIEGDRGVFLPTRYSGLDVVTLVNDHVCYRHCLYYFQ